MRADRDRLLENFKRNKESRAKLQRGRRIGWRSLVAILAAVGGALLLAPGKLNLFLDDAIALKTNLVTRWLAPERWNGLYSTRPEGYVDLVDLRLSGQTNAYLSLNYEPEFNDFDGEIISRDFCASGYPYANVLIRGHQNWLRPNRLQIVVYDIISGSREEFGRISAVIDGPVIEFEGWIFNDATRVTVEHVVTRDQLETLCVASFE